MTILINLLMAVQIASTVILLTLVALQTTKSEGLSGTIGGKMTSTFRGKPGKDELFSIWTQRVAIAFFVCTLAVYVVRTKLGQ
jgi:protein translocase SecG subunit